MGIRNRRAVELPALVSAGSSSKEGRIFSVAGVLYFDTGAVLIPVSRIEALAASDDDVLQRKAGAWTNRTPGQLKTDLALVKGDVGLGNVDNTSDANKPVSTAQQTALNLKANLASPALTGNPTAPTQTAGNNSTRLATTAFVGTAIANAVPVLASGTYSPTLSQVTGYTGLGTVGTFRYQRVGDIVHVAGSVSYSSASGTFRGFDFTLPIAAEANNGRYSGVAVRLGVTDSGVGTVDGQPNSGSANARCQLVDGNSGGGVIRLEMTYQIL